MEWRRGGGERSGFRGGRGRGRSTPRRTGFNSSSSSSRPSWSSGQHSEEWRSSSSNSRPDPKMVNAFSDREDDAKTKRGSCRSFFAFVGTCPDMCPANERFHRERLRDLSIFERLDGNPGKTSSMLAVKKFCRNLSSLNVQESEIRPLPVLQETFTYLFCLLHSSDHPFEVVHDFVSDRTRSIRQDLSIQRINNDQAIYMYEEMVKFHIFSHQKLLRISEESTSSVHLNMEQLIKVLTSLYDMYSIKRISKEIIRKEAEFYSFYVLLYLGRKSQRTEDFISVWFRNLPVHVLQSKEMCFARAVLRYFQMGNYVHFFRIISTDSSYFQLCLVEPFVNEKYSIGYSVLLLTMYFLRFFSFSGIVFNFTVTATVGRGMVRSRALMFINISGYKLHPYPVRHLSKLLMVEKSDLESICKLCKLEITLDKACGKLLYTKQDDFCLPNGGFQHYNFVGSERLQRWQEMITDAGNLFEEL